MQIRFYSIDYIYQVSVLHVPLRYVVKEWMWHRPCGVLPIHKTVPIHPQDALWYAWLPAIEHKLALEDITEDYIKILAQGNYLLQQSQHVSLNEVSFHRRVAYRYRLLAAPPPTGLGSWTKWKSLFGAQSWHSSVSTVKIVNGDSQMVQYRRLWLNAGLLCGL